MRETFHNQKVIPAIAPGVYSASAVGLTIDRSGYESLTFSVMVGAGGITFTDANRIQAYLEESDDGVKWSPPFSGEIIYPLKSDGTLDTSKPIYVGAASNMLANMLYVADDTTKLGTFMMLRTAHPDPDVTKCGCISDRRFYRIGLQFVGTHNTGTPISASAILGHPREMPVPA